MSPIPTRAGMRVPGTHRAATPLAALLVAALTLAGCAGQATSDGITDPGNDADPVTLSNCDQQVTVEEPPERAVSLNQGTTELMLALGLEDRMVGTATWTDPIREDLAEANDQVPRLADDTPSFESVLDTEPDFVIGAYHAMFTDGRVAPRERFEELGVPTYLSPSSCEPEAAELDEPVELEDLYGEIADVAEIFGVPERGEDLIDELRERVGEAVDRVRRADVPESTSVMFWFAQTDAPYMAGATGAPAAMTRELGVDNSYSDVDSMWPQVNWEDVLDRDPDLLVLGDLTRDGEGQSVESKTGFLENDPAVSELSVVDDQRWMPMTGSELNITIRTVDGIESLADTLVELHG
ncbi:iron complex transport system substrate-binding protein [Haloechinothrix alba]|uniref:Iron complex transport system substrate-binding protein n=1 Tax=Haloechinothrix alba TaxID=664784 RepID=A0A238YCB0_9PSEU|nr:ABC transporter substrate-binding protein [Haloechinothrix alba]SNR68916.1 iron complex transport system substrate-binding protein [Haloechinothrix alba]